MLWSSRTRVRSCPRVNVADAALDFPRSAFTHDSFVAWAAACGVFVLQALLALRESHEEDKPEIGVSTVFRYNVDLLYDWSTNLFTYDEIKHERRYSRRLKKYEAKSFKTEFEIDL